MQVEFKQLQLFQVKEHLCRKLNNFSVVLLIFRVQSLKPLEPKLLPELQLNQVRSLSFSPFIEFLIVLIFIYVIL